MVLPVSDNGIPGEVHSSRSGSGLADHVRVEQASLTRHRRVPPVGNSPAITQTARRCWFSAALHLVPTPERPEMLLVCPRLLDEPLHA
jgi:hypothetical protein